MKRIWKHFSSSKILSTINCHLISAGARTARAVNLFRQRRDPSCYDWQTGTRCISLRLLISSMLLPFFRNAPAAPHHPYRHEKPTRPCYFNCLAVAGCAPPQIGTAAAKVLGLRRTSSKVPMPPMLRPMAYTWSFFTL